MENVERDSQTDAIIGAAMEVHWTLGPGFLEAVYQAALAIELAEKGIPFQKEVSIGINYNNFGLSSIELQAICSLEPNVFILC